MGGKGVSYVSGTERSTVAVSPTTNLDTFSVQDKTQDKFYGVHPILPITAFTEKYLEEIIANDRKCALYIKDKVEFVLIKLAALRVQRLVITIIHGEHNQINILSLDKSITNINAICCNLAHEHILSSTDSYTLWPIDQHEYLTPTFSSLKKTPTKLYKAYYQSLKSHKIPIKTVPTDEEKSAYLIKIENDLKKIKDSGRVNETCFDANIGTRRVCQPLYYPLPEKDIDSMDANNPGLRSAAKKHDAFILSKELFVASPFEEKLLACYNLYSESGNNSHHRVFKTKPLFFLEIYKELLKNDLNSGNLTIFQAQQIACLWMMTLSKYFRFYQKIIAIELFTPGLKSFNENSDPSAAQSQLTLNKAKANCRKCLSLTIWDRDNGFLNLAVHLTLKELCISVFVESNDLKNTTSLNNELILEIAYSAINASRDAQQKQHAYSEYLSLCDLMGYEESFYQILDAASQYTSFASLIRILHDVGLSETNYV